MSENLPKDVNIDFSYFAVALVDILGQTEKLMRMGHLPRDARTCKEFWEAVKESFGVIKGLRCTFDDYLAAYVEHEPQETDGVTQNQIHLLSRMAKKKTDIRKQQFSDTMIFYTSLEETLNSIPISGVLGIFLALSATLITALSKGVTFRGGIDVGVGSSNCLGTRELYGPALYQTRELEEKKARYPRIVIGDAMRKYILEQMNVTGQEMEIQFRLRREIAKECKEMMCVDLDGLTVLDYLGSSVREFFNDCSAELRESINKAMRFVSEEYERFRTERDTELAVRYFMLRNYVHDRINKFWST